MNKSESREKALLPDYTLRAERVLCNYRTVKKIIRKENKAGCDNQRRENLTMTNLTLSL